jgi:hypothetical protein
MPALVAACVAAYTISSAAAAWVGFRFWIHWPLVQLLDAQALAHQPLRALLALHGQPPLLNALLAVAVRVGAWLGCGPRPLLWALFYGLGMLLVVLLGRLVLEVSGSLWLALAAALLTVADPALHVYRTVYFYELPLAVLLLVALSAAGRHLAQGGERWLLLFVLAVGAMALLRTLYHPLWAAALFALLLAGRAHLAPAGAPRERRWPAALLLALLLGIWPLKNGLLFGTPVMSSWAGYNLARLTAARSPGLEAYLATGEVAEALRESWRGRAPAFLRDEPVLVAPRRRDGNRNWNHYVFLLTDRELARAALRWRLEHPRDWLRWGFANYLLWGRPSYLDSYSQAARGPDHPAYRSYVRWHQRLLFPDLRRFVVRLSPAADVHRRTTLSSTPSSYSLFALLGLPALGLALALLLPRRLRRAPQAWVALLAACSLAWVLAVPCLSDGIEGNRMRYSVSPCVLLLAAWVVGAARRTPARRR